MSETTTWLDGLGSKFLEHVNFDDELLALVVAHASPFLVTCQLALRNSGMTLCHGYPLGQHEEVRRMRFCHAWVEKRLVIPLPEGARANIDADYDPDKEDSPAMTVTMALDVFAPTVELGWMPVQLYYFAVGIESQHVRRYPSALRSYTSRGNDGDYGPWVEPPEEYIEALENTAKFITDGGTLALTLPAELTRE